MSLEELVGDATGCPGSNVGMEYIPRITEQCLIAIDGQRRYRINTALGVSSITIYDAQGLLLLEQLASTTELDLSTPGWTVHRTGYSSLWSDLWADANPLVVPAL